MRQVAAMTELFEIRRRTLRRVLQRSPARVQGLWWE